MEESAFHVGDSAVFSDHFVVGRADGARCFRVLDGTDAWRDLALLSPPKNPARPLLVRRGAAARRPFEYISRPFVKYRCSSSRSFGAILNAVPNHYGKVPLPMKVWMDDASSLADAVRRREVRAADALDAPRDAIQRSELNTVVTLDAEGARRQAAAIDERLSRGEDPGLFAGVPLLVKDVEDAAGGATSPGPVGVKSKNTGRERTPAGSSGGPAAAVSGGLVPLATAGDGGGSIRIPASYCGLVGMKGTFGRIPRGPKAAIGQLAAVKGTVARSVRDAARWYDIAAGYDPRDPFSLPRIDDWEERLGNSDLRGLRVAVAPDLGNAVVPPEGGRGVRGAG